MTEPVLRPAPPEGVPYRLKVNASGANLAVLMLHGWSGDENVMWILETVLPPARLIAAPRGLYPLKTGGYQWSQGPGSLKSTMLDFQSAVDAVRAVVDELVQCDQLALDRLILMGFSQGAALSFSLASIGTFRPLGLICLAGFVPQGRVDSLRELPVFWGHGNQDELVPVERAHRDLDRLTSAGVEVSYCEADVGHRLGIECTRGLKSWIETLM